ncbi:hypothetical protein AOLI_G00153540 [Acnodon oligacanthus]
MPKRSLDLPELRGTQRKTLTIELGGERRSNAAEGKVKREGERKTFPWRETFLQVPAPSLVKESTFRAPDEGIKIADQKNNNKYGLAPVSHPDENSRRSTSELWRERPDEARVYHRVKVSHCALRSSAARLVELRRSCAVLTPTNAQRSGLCSARAPTLRLIKRRTGRRCAAARPAAERRARLCAETRAGFGTRDSGGFSQNG